MLLEFRKYQSVAAVTTVNHDYTLSEGEKIFLKSIGGTAIPSDSNAVVSIIWDVNGDNELLIATNSESNQECVKKLEGTGKIIRIKLDNQTLTSKTMGGFFLGYK